MASFGRTSLFKSLRRWINLATLEPEQLERAAEKNGCSAEKAETLTTSRRNFLKASSALAVTALTSNLLNQTVWSANRNDARIVIVGAGIAGLSAAYHLKRYGLNASIYEASNRTGGRIWSAQNIFAPNLVTELGAEFMDSFHSDMLYFVRLFNLKLIDVESRSERNLTTRYYFDGQNYTEAQIIQALRPFAQKIKRDAQLTGGFATYKKHNKHARELDQISLADYLTKIGMTGWLRKLIEVAYVTEYGLDTEEQSCLNLIFLIDTQLSDGFDLFGESDERYKVQGGNEQIVRRLAQMMTNQISLEHRLVAIRQRDKGYRLVFERSGGGYAEMDADFVLLTLPFTLLRNIDIQVELPSVKRQAINELGYGTNAKLVLGFTERFWRKRGYDGSFFTDEAFQSGWDSSQLQAGVTGSLTLFLGGKAGEQIGSDTPQSHAEKFLSGVERIFPEATKYYAGKTVRFHWSSYPFSLGSYACWKVGQYISIAGAEFEPVGRIFFAGEHTSLNYQGYMNGAAETGRLAARLIVRRILTRPPEKSQKRVQL